MADEQTPSGAFGADGIVTGASEAAGASEPRRGKAAGVASAFGGALILATCCFFVALPYAAVPGVPMGFGLTRLAFVRSACFFGLALVAFVFFEILVVIRNLAPRIPRAANAANGPGESEPGKSLRSIASRSAREMPFYVGVAAVLGLLSWPVTYAWCSVQNARTLAAPETFSCIVRHCGTKRCTVDCRDASHTLHEDMPHRAPWIPDVGASFRALARRGALGVWVLDTSSVRIVEALDRRPGARP